MSLASAFLGCSGVEGGEGGFGSRSSMPAVVGSEEAFGDTTLKPGDEASLDPRRFVGDVKNPIAAALSVVTVNKGR